VNRFFEHGTPVIGSATLPLNQLYVLRNYQKLDHNLVADFMQQNNMVNTKVVDQFIHNNFFFLEAISKTLTDSLLDVKGPHNILGEIMSHICSHLTSEDIILESPEVKLAGGEQNQ
jgi:hypothetical protein